MKINPLDLTKLTKITLDFAKSHSLKQRADYPGMSVTRFCWDVYHGMMDNAQLTNIENYFFLRSLGDYLNDDHLTTALKKALIDFV